MDGEEEHGDADMPHLEEEEAENEERRAVYSDAEELVEEEEGEEEEEEEYEGTGNHPVEENPHEMDHVEEEEEEEEAEGEIEDNEDEADGNSKAFARSKQHDEEEEEVEEEDLDEVPPPGYLDSAGEYEEGQNVEMKETNQTENNNNQDGTDEQPDASSKRKRTASQCSGDDGPKRKQVRSSGSVSGHKNDVYCWVCHKDGVQAFCKICPRAYHTKCMHVPDEASKGNPTTTTTELPTKTCICPECAIVMNAENLETRSETMKKLTVDQLIAMLKNACQRMKTVHGVEPFLFPVDPDDALEYFDYVVYPMDLSTLENNVKKRQYGSTEAFIADAQWLVHNSVVFNTATSPFTAIAKKILKVCRQEIQDIETCPECYVNAHNKPDVWFLQVCKRPHILVWAKLKGFPFWPAKAMRIKDDLIDVRFFGAHDRAWVVRKDCFLYSVENPSTAPPKKNNALLTAINELNTHIEKLKEYHGPFVFAATRTPIGPQLSVDQIRKMLPEFKPEDATAKVVLSSNAQAAKKSPVTIRISSLKTNPTIVTNSVVEEANKPILRIRKSAVAPEASPSHETNESSPEKTLLENESKRDEEEEQQQSSEENEEGADDDDPKPTGILATALGRPTRRSSRSEAGSASPAQDRPTINNLSEGKEREATPPPPPRSFLNSLGLSLKATDAAIRPKIGKLLHPSEVFIKSEPHDDVPEDEHSDGGGSSMNQMSGMRFNLSKDISISPVGEDGVEEMRPQQRRNMIQGHNARLLPGLIPQNMQMIGGRQRSIINLNGGGMQRMAGQQNRLVQRNPRPGGVPLRPGMKMNGPRPLNMQLVPIKNQGIKPKDGNSSSLLVEPTTGFMTHGNFQSTVQVSQVNPMGGPITLPGGTITVTPLAPVFGVPITDSTLNGDQVIVKQNIASTANGLPISVLTPHDGSQSLLKSNNKQNPQRKNLMNQVPPSVGHIVQNLQKSLVEQVRGTMEQIVVEMLEKSSACGSGPEMKSLKEENEKLRKQLLDYKNNHDSTVRELKTAMEIDKKRTVSDQRKQLEQEKTKAIEETKKKQWCARCGREAQFYCCWNTSYCGYPCQEDHWPSHMNSCSQGSRQ